MLKHLSHLFDYEKYEDMIDTWGLIGYEMRVLLYLIYWDNDNPSSTVYLLANQYIYNYIHIQLYIVGWDRDVWHGSPDMVVSLNIS